ncbi:DNA polymerase III subunit alpha [Roseivirga sp. BDSF3-8]|uniref:DNA polymerase III subunit alpha n=1 Tax=Roseivirga sp. BDSF3-8 TaxID=3241598 RepID=UPI0035323B73
MYLNCHTYFSLKYGTLSPEQLYMEAKRHGIRKLVVTDIHNTSAYIELLRICEENRTEFDLQIAAGIEFRRNDDMLYIVVARNNGGFEEANRYLSHYNLTDKPLPSRAPLFNHCYVIYPMQRHPAPDELYENEYIGIRPREVNRLTASPLRSYVHKLVALQPVTFRDKAGFNLHRLLRAIDCNLLLSRLPESRQASQDEVMHPQEELMQYYWQYPQIIARTQEMVEECRLDFTLGESKNKKVFGTSKKEDYNRLRQLALDGFTRRYEQYDSYAMSRLHRELEVISQHNFEAYFLITHDIVQYAKHRNFAHVGRGSGANSLVAYCMGITDVDPIELDLYFERFLNPYRTSPPDFDIDFSWKERDEVIHHVFERHGQQHTALLATYNTFQDRSVLRELGKVFGLPKSEIDKVVAYPEEMHDRDEITRLMFRYGERLVAMPANLSIHAGGIVITDEPIYAYTATDLPPKGFPITHFDMLAAEDIGIHKYDVLSQRGLGHIKDTVNVVQANRREEVDITRVKEFKQDEKIKELLRKGQTMGCFYVESPAMRMLLGKLQCEDYLTLVAASSIIRPGVARSGMMREYIHRHHHPDDFEYIHPKMEELMKESHGVMVYQEDVLKVAHHFAGLDLGEADILRRGMSGKFRSRKEFKRVEQAFFDNCREKGHPEEIAKEVWRQIESFSGYSFSKAHSASFAVESYQSLYLKAHYPLEFMVGVINNFGGFYKTEFYVHEARMAGATIEAPCVNTSDYLTDISGHTIWLGFIHLKNLETRIGQSIGAERQKNGPYRNLEDFVRRIPIGLEQLLVLIRVNGFRFTGKQKNELLWEAHLFFNKPRQKAHVPMLFDTSARKWQLPSLNAHPLMNAFDEIELLGFTLCDPFLLLEDQYMGDTTAENLMKKLKKRVELTGYLVTTKNTRTKDGKLMHFGTFLDHEGNVFDTTHFPNSVDKYPFRGRGFYRIRGRVVEDFGYPMIEVSYMAKLPMVHREKILEGQQEV